MEAAEISRLLNNNCNTSVLVILNRIDSTGEKSRKKASDLGSARGSIFKNYYYSALFKKNSSTKLASKKKFLEF